VAAWTHLAEFELATDASIGRWVVVDVETSGLNALSDRLISIGALGVRGAAVDLADSFEIVLRQDEASSGANIEIHGIGGAEQRGGGDPVEALVAFLEFTGKDPLVAYHAGFDSTVLERAVKSRLGVGWRRPWLDLAEVAPIAWPNRATGPGLDGWLDPLGIPMARRHRAIVDCLATAQLLCAVLREAPRLGATTMGNMLALAGDGR
jgi:DNA polymerase-3 subunit epsilon